VSQVAYYGGEAGGSMAAAANHIEIGPQPGPQTAFLRCQADVAFYGGQAGGGKSYGLLLNPLYHMSNSGFGAVTFRRTTKQILSEGGLWDTAADLYSAIGARSNLTQLHWTWASGAKHTFAHMEHEKNRLDWQGAQIALIQWDELTHFTWKQFNYLLSRNRSLCGVKPTIRATLNPDPDHWAREWVDWYVDDEGFAIERRSGMLRWFVVDQDDVYWSSDPNKLKKRFPKSIPKSFTFIPAKLTDNQILMETNPGYLANLMALTRVERARLLGGNWNIRPSAGMFFRRSDVEIVDVAPTCVKWTRAWDQAGTKKKTDAKSDDPDWTAGVRMGRTPDRQYVIDHVERFRADPAKVDKRIKNTASSDGKEVLIRLAQDPGQAGKSQARSQITMLAGYAVRAKPVTGDKATRAKPLSSQWEAGNVILVKGPWNEPFLNEMENFTGTDEDVHDDQVDAAADAFDELCIQPAKPLFGTYGNRSADEQT
jgi:predicted phage terminase large subunit-like protein